MRLYETSTPGEFLALQFDPQELARFQEGAREWRRQYAPKKKTPGIDKQPDERQTDLLETFEQWRLDSALAPVAQLIDQGNARKILQARVWARYWINPAQVVTDFGVDKLDGAAERTNMRKTRQDYQDEWDYIVYSKPLAECLAVYRLRAADVWTNPPGLRLVNPKSFIEHGANVETITCEQIEETYRETVEREIRAFIERLERESAREWNEFLDRLIERRQQAAREIA